MKHLLPIFTLFLLVACARKTTIPPSLATLKPVGRVMVTDKSNFPDVNRYTMTLYSDQRLELTGTSGIDKIGQHTTMLSPKEKEMFIAMFAKFKRGHFTFFDDKEKFLYDVIYYPLKKELSMADAVQLPQTPDMQSFISKVNEFLTYKNWLRKTDVPSFFSGADAGNMLVTLRNGAAPSAVTTAAKYADMKFKTIIQTDKISNTWLFGFAEGIKTTDAVYKIKSHPDVLGAVPNILIDLEKNIKTFENQSLIIQFKQSVTIEDWVKTYAANGMKAGERVAPDLNYWVVTYNSSTLSAKEMIAKIKSDPKVAEAQLNRKVSVRE